MKVSVSILKEYNRLINVVRKVNESKADFLHVDVMDGVFVDDIKFPLEVAKDVISYSKKKIDMHLMVNDLDTVIKYASLKPDYLTFHVEIIKDNKILHKIKSLGIKVGLAINPETKIDKLLPYIDDIDLVLFMSVNPGKGGQEFKSEVLDKIKVFKKMINKDLIINIDGGVNDLNVKLCEEAGCNMVVAGSYITNADNYNERIKLLKQS